MQILSHRCVLLQSRIIQLSSSYKFNAVHLQHCLITNMSHTNLTNQSADTDNSTASIIESTDTCTTTSHISADPISNTQSIESIESNIPNNNHTNNTTDSTTDTNDSIPAQSPITLTINGPLRWWSTNDCNKLFHSINLQYDTLYRINKKSNEVTLYFSSVIDKQIAIELLNNTPHLFGTTSDKKYRIKDTPSDALKRKYNYDRTILQQNINKKQTTDNNNDNESNSVASKDTTTDEPSKPPKTVVEVVCPFFHIPYDKQIQYKRTDINRLFRSSYKRLIEQYKSNINLIHATQGMICPIESMVPSPIINGYRNKCEFNCALNVHNQKTAGFQLGKYSADGVIVEECYDCPNVPDITKYSTRLFNDFIRGSEYDVYNKSTRSGVWRMLTVRNSVHNKQLMVCIQICSNELTDEQVESLQSDLTQFFITHTSSDEFTQQYGTYQLTSLLLRIHNGINDVCDDTIQPIVLHGQSYITDTLLNLQFNITLTSFFQINIPSAELLYQKAAEYAQCNTNTVLFDICCGTGTIGITMSKQVQHVIGLELIESAVTDARNNALLNNINNCTFISGKAEHTLKQAIHDYVTADTSISVIVDPPRAGLHSTVLKLLRSTVQLNRLIYISCNIKSMITDIEKLCKPSSKEWRGQSFVPVKATLVDMFPHCDHTECVMVLER